MPGSNAVTFVSSRENLLLDFRKEENKMSKSQGSDRGSSYDASCSEAESSSRNRSRHRINRVKVVEDVQEKPPMKGDGFPFIGAFSKNKLSLCEPHQSDEEQ